jgi:hypothetical protein
MTETPGITVQGTARWSDAPHRRYVLELRAGIVASYARVPFAT